MATDPLTNAEILDRFYSPDSDNVILEEEVTNDTVTVDEDSQSDEEVDVPDSALEDLYIGLDDLQGLNNPLAGIREIANLRTATSDLSAEQALQQIRSLIRSNIRQSSSRVVSDPYEFLFTPVPGANPAQVSAGRTVTGTFIHSASISSSSAPRAY